MLPDTANAVLDFGCGPGNFTELLAKKYPTARVVGADRATMLLPTSTDRVDYVSWKGDTPFPTGERFDLITAKMVLHYLDDAELRRLSYHLLNALEDDGIIAYSVPHPVDSSRFNSAKNDEWQRRNMLGSIMRKIGATGIEARMYHRSTIDWINVLWNGLKKRGLRYTFAIDDVVYDDHDKPKRLNIMLLPVSRLDVMDSAYSRLEAIHPTHSVAIEVPPDDEVMTGDLGRYDAQDRRGGVS